MNQQPKILIVDDEPFNVDYLEQELEDFNYKTVSASNGREALEKVQSESPDLVLLDIMMPIMDGFSVLTAMKADPATRDIPVIIISAMNDLDSIVRGVKLGAEDYLPKPFEPTLLHARISSSVEKKRLRDKEQIYLQSLERELNIAREIQKEFLPLELPSIQGWNIGAHFQSAKDVAGDFYDAFTLPDGNLICVIGDVCGKGVGAALFMTLFRSLIHATATSADFSNEDQHQPRTPAERLYHAISFTNNYVARIHEASSMFATIFICLINVETGTLSYINAGNDMPYLLHADGTVEELSTTGPAIGAIEDAKFKVKETQLNNGDLFVAFTDGIPDSLNAQGEFYGRNRMIEIIKLGHLDAATCLTQIGADLTRFIGEAEQFDDITLPIACPPVAVVVSAVCGGHSP